MIYLASASLQRKILLEQLNISFTQIITDIDESVLPKETVQDYVCRVAKAKAKAGFLSKDNYPLKPVLGADTTVSIDNHILGKPKDQAHALEMLALLSNKTHYVLTAVALCFEQGIDITVSKSKVIMDIITPEQALAYWQSGEPQGKAGAYAIQGLGAIFVKHIEGSYSGIKGLPLFETANLLKRNNLFYGLQIK